MFFRNFLKRQDFANYVEMSFVFYKAAGFLVVFIRHFSRLAFMATFWYHSTVFLFDSDCFHPEHIEIVVFWIRTKVDSALVTFSFIWWKKKYLYNCCMYWTLYKYIRYKIRYLSVYNMMSNETHLWVSLFSKVPNLFQNIVIFVLFNRKIIF